jgi:hypothetical protein
MTVSLNSLIYTGAQCAEATLAAPSPPLLGIIKL